MKPRTLNRFVRIKRAQREKDAAEFIRETERQADPIEQAKSFLRSRGYLISLEECGRRFIIGTRRQQSEGDLVAIAERNGWEVPARERSIVNRRTGR